MTRHCTVIIGANSSIAQALCLQIVKNNDSNIILISRDLNAYCDVDDDCLKKIEVENYIPESIKAAVQQVSEYAEGLIDRVFICQGILHTESIHPEKRLEDFSLESYEQVMRVNAITPLLWIKHLTPILKSKIACKVITFSARVGSISDNNLGGWYSYRASKAALNMMLKTAAIEIARRAKNIKIIAFHPGTTDTQLSKPFQNNIPAGKLFSCDFVAQQLLTIVSNSVIDGKASFVDWQGETIGW